MSNKIHRVFESWELDARTVEARIEKAKNVIGENLYALRMSRCVKLIGVAKATKLPGERISKIEKGKLVRLTLDDLCLLATYYNVKVSSLFVQKRDKKKQTP